MYMYSYTFSKYKIHKCDLIFEKGPFPTKLVIEGKHLIIIILWENGLLLKIKSQIIKYYYMYM